jgi:hypothetical protein
MPRCCWLSILFQDCDCSFQRILKRSVSAQGDLPVFELPTDAFLNKEVIYCLCKAQRILLAALTIVSNEARVKSFNEVVDLELLTVVEQLLDFLPNIRVLAPVIWVRNFSKHSAQDISQGGRCPIQFARSLQNAITEILGRFLPHGDFLGHGAIALTLREWLARWRH